MRRLCLIAGAVTALAGVPAPAAGAEAPAAEWRQPVTIARDYDRHGIFASLTLAAAPDGEALLAWSSRQPRFIRAVSIAADGGIGEIRTFSRPGERAGVPLVGVGKRGEAVLAWRSGAPERRRVVAVTRSRAGDWGSPRVVSTAGKGSALLQTLAVAPDGHAVIGWSRHARDRASHVEVAFRRPGGRFGAPHSLPVPRASDVGDVRAAIRDGGEVALAWTHTSRPGARSRVEVALGDAAALGAPRRVSAAGAKYPAPRVAMAPDGGAVLAWLQRRPHERIRLAAARRAPGKARFGRASLLTSSHAAGPAVTVSGGRVWVAWSALIGGPRLPNSSVRVVSAPVAAGGFGAAQALSSPGDAAWDPKIRASGGRVVAVWHGIPQSGPQEGRGIITGAWGDGGGRLGRQQRLSELGGIVQSGSSPRLAIDDRGVALAAYIDYDVAGAGPQGQIALVRLSAGRRTP